MALEEMGSFFDARVDGYEQHMFENVDGADVYYRETARRLPVKNKLRLLDLGCGTGLELDELFILQPDACVTGVDLSAGMLARLGEKHADKQLTLIKGDYFRTDFGAECFDAAVSVQTMHHFAWVDKVRLYRKILVSLMRNGIYVETDYMAPDQEYENRCLLDYRNALEQSEARQGCFHFDTPFTVAHQAEMLKEAGFVSVQCVWQAANTAILVAKK